jgi:hypothetical protein
VAPDGLHYAYMTGGSPSASPGPPNLHVVDAASGAEKLIALGLPQQQPYGVDFYGIDGVYVASSNEGGILGVWRVDPITGAVANLGTQEPFEDDGTGHAWVSVVDARDPNPARSALTGQPLPDEVGRRDLKTGAVEIWFYHQGANVAFVNAFVGGGIVAWVEPSTGPHEYWLVTVPGNSRLIAQIDYGGASMVDVHGVWLGGRNGLFLFKNDGGFVKLSDLPGEPGGGCLTA